MGRQNFTKMSSKRPAQSLVLPLFFFDRPCGALLAQWYISLTRNPNRHNAAPSYVNAEWCRLKSECHRHNAAAFRQTCCTRIQSAHHDRELNIVDLWWISNEKEPWRPNYWVGWPFDQAQDRHPTNTTDEGKTLDQRHSLARVGQQAVLA